MHGQRVPVVELVVTTVKLRKSFAFAEKVYVLTCAAELIVPAVTVS